MDTFLRNLRHGLRTLAKSPGFATVAILTLALGIGANTAIFSVVNSVLLQPLSYPNPERLVELELSGPQGNSDVTSIPKFNVWREQAQVFDSVAAYDFGGPGIHLTGGDRPEQIQECLSHRAVLPDHYFPALASCSKEAFTVVFSPLVTVSVFSHDLNPCFCNFIW